MLTDWATLWTNIKGGEPLPEQLDYIEMCVMNEWALYNRFYRDASDADYDAPLVDVKAKVI